MRLLTPLLVLLLIVSVGVNLIAYTKLKGSRPIFSVNGEGVTRRNLDDFLENKEGPSVKAVMVQRMLVTQEAKKQGVLPTDAEVTELFENQKEGNWQFAYQVNQNPWTASETKNNILAQLAANRLRLKDIKVTDEQIKEEYNLHPYGYDTPDKAHASLAIITDESKVPEIKADLMKNPPISPSAIMTQFPNQVMFIGNEYKYTFQRPFEFKGNYSNKPLIDIVFGLKPGEVKDLPLTVDIQQIGGKAMLVKLIDVVPGKKADLNDPKTKEKIREVVAAKTAKPWKEILSGIWAKTDFQSDNPEDKKIVEKILFPERGR